MSHRDCSFEVWTWEQKDDHYADLKHHVKLHTSTQVFFYIMNNIIFVLCTEVTATQSFMSQEILSPGVCLTWAEGG